MSERDELDEDGGPSTSKRSKFGSAANADCQAVTVRTPQQSTERILASELDERIFTYVSNSNSFSFAKFGFLKLGPLCNASESHSFTEANCHVKTVRNENNLALILEFSQLFSRGVMLLSDVKNNRRELDRQEIAAIKILDNFFKEKDQHEKCLNKGLRGHQSETDKKGFSGTEIAVTLAEHLLGKLAPGKSYVVDEKVKRKGKCRRGYEFCESDPMFGSTGIGHEEGWHGFADIVLSSHDGVPDTISTTHINESQESATLTCSDDDCDDDYECSSSGGKTISDAKLFQSKTSAENRAVAQTIVFSFLQRKRLPEFPNLLIPNILISPQEFRIIMYDAVNDILMCSVPLPIFQPYPSNSLEIASIIILWMVLHHRIFCEGTDALIREMGIERKKIQADFKERAKEKFELYVNELKYGVQGFPFVQRESLPSFKALLLGVHLLPNVNS